MQLALQQLKSFCLSLSLFWGEQKATEVVSLYWPGDNGTAMRRLEGSVSCIGFCNPGWFLSYCFHRGAGACLAGCWKVVKQTIGQ